MKILKHIIRGTIWTILGLYILTVSLIQIPSVKDCLGRQTSSILSEKLGTKVHVGRVDLGFFNRLIIDDVVIYDRQHKEMIKSARLSAKIELIPLLENRISISSAQMFGTDFILYQTTENEAPNFQFIIDALSSKDNNNNESSFDLRINTFIMQHSSLKFDRYDMAPTNSKLNINHIDLNNISAHISIKALNEDSLNFIIKKLSFKENKSNLQINRLSLKMEGNRRKCNLHDFTLKMPETDIRIDNINATYRFKENTLVKSSLKYHGNIESGKINPSDFAFILPPLKRLTIPLNLSSNFHGTYSKFQMDKFIVSSPSDDIDINIKGWISGWNRIIPNSNVTIKNISVSSELINTINHIMKNTGNNFPDILTRLGNINIHGTLSSNDGVLKAKSKLETEAGSVDVDMSLSEDKSISGSIVTQSVNLGQILNNERFGSFTASASIQGSLQNNGHRKLDINGNIPKFEFNGYQYSDITIRSLLKDNSISGRLDINDSQIKMHVDGTAEKTKELSDIRFTASVRNFSASATRLTDKWGDAVFNTDISTTLKGRDIEHAIGEVSLCNFSLLSSEAKYILDKMEISSTIDADRERHLMMNSDFGTARLSGRFDYNTIYQSIINIIRKRLPTIPGLPAISNNTHNRFDIEANISNTEWIEKVFNIPLHINNAIDLTCSVNETEKDIFIDCSLPSFRYDGKEYRNGKISVTSNNDSLHSKVGVIKIMDNGQNMKLNLTGNAADNSLHTSFSWDNCNTGNRISGCFNAETRFSGDSKETANASITIQPSHINLNNSTWNIEPSTITYTKDNVDIDRFAVTNDKQHIIINGKASKTSEDSITIDLHDIDVEYILDLVNFHSVDFSGRATGTACISAPFGNMKAHGNIIVNDFRFENGRMGVLNANVKWDNEEKQININAISTDGPEVMTCIDGYISPKRSYIDLGIKAIGTSIEFMKSFTSSFISDINGQANGEVRLTGPLKAINLVGELVINGDAHIKSTNCKYYLRNDTVTFIPDEIELHDIPIFDIHDNMGIMSGGIHHKHLTRLSYDLFVKADNLLAYDFHSFGDETFYGTVYGTGNVGIHGRSGELDINVNITPNSKSTFVYNVSNPDAISKQEFINWNDVTSATSGYPNEKQREKKTAAQPNILTDTHINFLINCTPDVTVKLLMDNKTNDYITLNGNGVLRASYYNKGTFNMFGTYVVERGTYDITIQDIIKKNFIFNKGGTIVFGGDPYNANLNLQAIYTVNGVSLSDLNIGNSFKSNTIRVNCLMNIGGQPMAPVVDFDIDMPTLGSDEKQMIRSIINSEDEMNQQVLYLLGIGRFYPQEANNSSAMDNQPSQTSLAMQGLLSGTISSQLNTMLNTVINNNNWNFGANISPGDEGWNNAEYEGQLSGRLLNNRLLINGQFGYRDNQKNASTSFIGDFDVRYLLFPNGNLSINIYNKTNDRYFTKSSLNTQGIGLTMKKDFVNLKDLFGIKKKNRKPNSNKGRKKNQSYK